MRAVTSRTIRLGVVGGLLLALIATATIASGRSAPKLVPVRTENGEQNGEKPNWDAPFVDSVSVPGLAVAASKVAFHPKAAAALGKASGTFVHGSVPDRARQAVAFVYDHKTYGRYIVVELPTAMKPEALAEMAAACQTGCEGSWTMIDLPNGLRGLLVAGPVSNGVVWVDGKVRFDLFGPAETFSVDAAKAMAAELAAA